jgi:hypothetical protein
MALMAVRNEALSGRNEYDIALCRADGHYQHMTSTETRRLVRCHVL